MAPISKLRRKEDGGRTVSTTDNGYGACLVGREADSESHHVCSEDTELGGGSDKHKLGVGDECGEVGHGTDAQKDERGIPAGSHAVVENVENRPFFVDADFEAGFSVERYITDKYAEAYGHQQHGLEVLFDGQPDEEQAYGKHHEVAELGVGKTGELPELQQVVIEKIAERHNSIYLRSGLFYSYQYGAFEYGVTGVDSDGSHSAVCAGVYGVFHFHSFEHYHGVGCFHSVTNLYRYGEHNAGKRSLDCGAGTGGCGLGNNFFAACSAGSGGRTRGYRFYCGGLGAFKFYFIGHSVDFHLGDVVVDVAHGNFVYVAVDFILVFFHC